MINLGQNGASTSREKQNYMRFIDSFGQQPDVLIFQYFGNDIEDFLDTSHCRFSRTSVSNFIIKFSYIYSLVDTIFLQKEFGSCYREALRNAYMDDGLFEKHKRQIKDLMRVIQSHNSKVIFVVFPFLHNETEILNSAKLYVEKLDGLYQTFCQKGDWFYDVSHAALSLKTSERVANFMDAHPSSKLHRLVANELEKMVASAEAGGDVDGAYTCK